MNQQSSPDARRVFDYLVRCAREKRTVTYGEVGDACGLHHRALRRPLAYIWEEICHRRALPLLTALVVYTDTRRPGPGFWPSDLPEAEREAWWRAEVVRVFTFDWSTVPFEETAIQGGAL